MGLQRTLCESTVELWVIKAFQLARFIPRLALKYPTFHWKDNKCLKLKHKLWLVYKMKEIMFGAGEILLRSRVTITECTLLTSNSFGLNQKDFTKRFKFRCIYRHLYECVWFFILFLKNEIQLCFRGGKGTECCATEECHLS